MTDQWERFAAQQTRFQDALGFDQTVDVYVPTSTPDPGQGYSISYPGTPTATVDAEVSTPSGNADRDEGGSSAEYDAEVRVTDDTGVSWRDYDAAGEAPIVVQDTRDSRWLEIQTVASEHNGLLVMQATETEDPR